jgi:type IV pilus assembly protein PilM
MLRLTKTQLQPIGLDIGYDGIRMLQLEVTGEGVSVRAAARAGFAEEIRETTEARLAGARESVRRMLHEQPFTGRRVVVALPPEMVHVKNHRLPPMPASEVESAVRLEARNLFRFETDDARVHWLPAGEVRQGNDVLQEVIVLAVRDEDVDRYVEQVHRCGVIVDSVDVEPCALFRSVERFIRRREDEQEVHVLADVGLHATQVVIGKGRDVSFLKTIEIGTMRFHQAISTKLGISLPEARALRARLLEGSEANGEGSTAGGDAAADRPRDPVRQAVFDATRGAMEQLARELSLCVRYQSVTFRGHRPTRVRLLGTEAGDVQFQGILHSILNIAVEAGRPLLNVDVSRMRILDRRGASAEWALALGLGLKWTAGRFAPRDGRPRGATPAAAADTGQETTMSAVAATGATAAEYPGASKPGEASNARA